MPGQEKETLPRVLHQYRYYYNQKLDTSTGTIKSLLRVIKFALFSVFKMMMDSESYAIYAERATLINAIKSSSNTEQFVFTAKLLSEIICNSNILTNVRNICDLSKEVLNEDAV